VTSLQVAFLAAKACGGTWTMYDSVIWVYTSVTVKWHHILFISFSRVYKTVMDRQTMLWQHLSQ